MSLILHIDTALETAKACLSANGMLLQERSNPEQQDHAAWLHPAIESLLQECGKSFSDLTAVAVSMGPGSYTGLRVGLSAAKGFCFSLQVPLIGIGTLELIAESVKDEAVELICPMIDARRMEVYTAIYDKTLKEIMVPQAMILDENSLAGTLAAHPILFCGNGSKKLQGLIRHPHAAFTSDGASTAAFVRLSQKFLLENKFTDLAYAEPLYVKEFYSPARKE